MNIKEFFIGYKGKDMPKELKGFNLGACIFTFIWGAKYKAWITFLIIPLAFIKLPLGLNWLLIGILQIYFGIMGNMWAYQVDWWKKPADFRRTQNLWAFSALLISVLVPIIAGVFIVRFVKKSPDNPMEFIRNSQCAIAQGKINAGIKYVSPTSNANEIAADFSKRFKNTQLEDSRVMFLSGTDKAYYISFDKFDSNAPCDLANKNCVITSTYKFSEYVPIEPCVFYFDNAKNVVPDESTAKALEKGANIFKYL